MRTSPTKPTKTSGAPGPWYLDPVVFWVALAILLALL